MGRLSAGRELALRACAQVRERDAYVDNVVNSMIHRAKLPHEERAFAEVLATGVTQTVGTLRMTGRDVDARDAFYLCVKGGGPGAGLADARGDLVASGKICYMQYYALDSRAITDATVKRAEPACTTPRLGTSVVNG